MVDPLPPPRVMGGSRRRRISLRINGALFGDVDAALSSGGRDSLETEVAGFLLCRLALLPRGRLILLARAWKPVPAEMRITTPGYGLAWRPEFNAAIADEAEATKTAPVLVHRHPSRGRFGFSGFDRDAGRPLLAPISRSLLDVPVGMVVYNDESAAGEFWRAGKRVDDLLEMVVSDAPIRRFRAQSIPVRPTRARLLRQAQAIGPRSDAQLAASTAALVGLSGGGSHCAQQLAHQGFGGFDLIDDQDVDPGNRGRLIGSRASDDGRRKTAVAERLIKEIEPRARVTRIDHRSSHPDAIAAIAGADLVIASVDTFRARAEINAICRRYLVPLIDVGMTLTSDGEELTRAFGQVVLTLPGGPCMRCLPLLSDSVLKAEAQRKPPGYDENEGGVGDPQVVSMNGVLASQAANIALALVTGYLPTSTLRMGGYWQYDALAGELAPSEMPPLRRDCPGCAEDAEGDFDGLT
jgi:molybdopterin/thiamine biosynthesis adenylyltransferase